MKDIDVCRQAKHNINYANFRSFISYGLLPESRSSMPHRHIL